MALENAVYALQDVLWIHLARERPSHLIMHLVEVSKVGIVGHG